MADVSYGGFAPRRNQGIIGRSLSFCTGRNMTWRSTASPVDIPGASPPKPSTRRCLLSASVPESTDAVLSRSILEQCRIADRTCDTSPRASLKECGSWASRTCSEAAGSSSITPWSTWKASSSSSKEGGGGVAAQSLGKSSCNHQMTSASVKTEFAKRREPQKQARDQVSALSVALRGLSRSALNVAEGQRDQIGAAQREHQEQIKKHVTAAEIQSSMVGLSLEKETLPHSDVEAGQPVSIPDTKCISVDTVSESSPATSLTSSSTTTCSMSSDASSVGFASREEQIRTLLDRLMEYFFAVCANMHTQNGTGTSVCDTPSSRSSVPSRSSEHLGGGAAAGGGRVRAGANRSGKRRASRSDDGGESGDSDSDEDDKRPRLKKRIKDGETQPKRLACPFFKRNPRRYQEERSCVGPGWKTTHRLKEHIYRCHTLPVYCLRCHKVFNNEDLLREHSLSEIPCQKRHTAQSAEPTLEGIGLSQERRLRSRKRSEKTEEEKWVEVYKICFPDDLTVPTPYYELPTPAESPAANRTSELAQYEEFVRSELPRRVRSELEKRIERELIPIEENLKGQLVEIVRDLQLKLLEEFKEPRKHCLQTPDEPDESWVAVPPTCLAQCHSLVQQQPSSDFAPAGPPSVTSSSLHQPLDPYPFSQRGLSGDDWATSDGLMFGFAPEAEDWSGLWTSADQISTSKVSSSAAEIGLASSKSVDGNGGMMFTRANQQHLAGTYLQDYRL